ncbi:MAG: extracellular solute-binding protein [Actinomycetota bacterium]
MIADEHAQANDRRMNRRRFLRASARTALALPGLPALLAACTGGGGRTPTTSPTPSAALGLARPAKPVTLPLFDEVRPIAAGLDPEQRATVQLYTWPNYVWRTVLDRFASEFDTTYRVQTFTDVASDAAPKLAVGQVTPDVFWPTVDQLAPLVAARLFLSLTHAYLPNLAKNVWKSLRNPFYDRGSRYSVPYTVWTTGIGYRRDRIDDAEVADKGWDLFWDPRYAGKVGIYDDYREAISLALLHNGVANLNTADAAELDAAAADLVRLRRSAGVRISRDGPYTALPAGDLWLHQATSADMVGAQWFLPAGTSTNVLGYWWPEDGKGPVGSDAMVVPASADDPVLAHLLLNFLLDPGSGIRNFSWTGCQPPLTALDADLALGRGYVPETLAAAIVTEADLRRGCYELELAPEVDKRWQAVWQRVKAAA